MNQIYLLYFCLFLLIIAASGVYFNFSIKTFIVLFSIVGFFSLLLLISVIYSVYRFIKEKKMYVPFVPTSEDIVNEMIKFTDIKKGDNIYDLGCGDGRIVIEASKIENTKCVGIEWKKDIYLMAKINNFLKKGKAILKNGDMYKLNIADADIIFTYLLPNAMEKLEEKIKDECKDGTIIISHGFRFNNIDLQEERQIGKVIIRKYKLNKNN